MEWDFESNTATRCNTLQHANETLSQTLRHTLQQSNTLMRLRIKHRNTLQHIATHKWEPELLWLWDTLLNRLRMCCNVLQCVAVCCSVLQCVAVCYSVLQCAAVCCSVLQCHMVLQCVAECCSVLQCVAVRCSVWHCVAVCCRRQVYSVCCESQIDKGPDKEGKNQKLIGTNRFVENSRPNFFHRGSKWSIFSTSRIENSRSSFLNCL